MKEQQFVLALYPTVRGYAFVLFEGPESPFDWGTKDVREVPKNEHIIELVARLLDRYHPELLIMEDHEDRRCRRTQRIKRLCRSLVDLATACDIQVHLYSKEAVKQCFAPAGARTKYEIAQAVARHIPAFKHRLPPLRKIWMSEDPRQSLFDAAALGLTHYASHDAGLSLENETASLQR